MDVGHAEELVLQAARGDQDAFDELVQFIWPGTRREARSDGPEDVGQLIIEKLQSDEFRALRLYEDWRLRHPDKTLLDWLRIVAGNITRDHLRELRGQDGLPTPQQLLNAFALYVTADGLGTRPPLTWAQTTRQLLEFARGRLSEAHCGALEEWLDGAEIEPRSVRSAITALRRELG